MRRHGSARTCERGRGGGNTSLQESAGRASSPPRRAPRAAQTKTPQAGSSLLYAAALSSSPPPPTARRGSWRARPGVQGWRWSPASPQGLKPAARQKRRRRQRSRFFAPSVLLSSGQAERPGAPAFSARLRTSEPGNARPAAPPTPQRRISEQPSRAPFFPLSLSLSEPPFLRPAHSKLE